MKVTICGTRGSTPAAGKRFAKYGGNTPCIALSHRSSRPDLVIDAGTGIRSVTGLLEGRPFRGTILMTHLHWDHTEGLPFFAGADSVGAETQVLIPAQREEPQGLFARMMSPPFFPIGPEELDGLWEFDALEEGTHAFEDLEVLAREVPHKGGRTFGYRITDPSDHSLAYVPDHSPIQHGEGPQGLGEYHEAIVALTRDVDVLLHDAHHTAEEFEAVRGFGHSSIEYAIGLAENVGVKKLQLFHHSPNRDDDSLDALMASLPHSHVQVEAAREGTVLSFP